MKQLQEKLEFIYYISQTNKAMITQRDDLIEKMQAKLVLMENAAIDITSFKAQASEINENLEIVQQDIYQKVHTIRQ